MGGYRFRRSRQVGVWTVCYGLLLAAKMEADLEVRRGAVRSQLHWCMSKQVLVLNASYEPLSLVSVRRAIVLLLREKAELLEVTQQMLRSNRQKMPVPLVIRLVHFVRLPHRKVPSTRSAVMLRDAYTCQYCGETPGRQFLTVDHV